MISSRLKNTNNYNHSLSFIQKLWSISFFIYIVCMITFTGTTNTAIINKVSLYAFLSISIINIIKIGRIKLNVFTISLIFYGIWILFSYFYSPSKDIFIENMYFYFTAVVICIFAVNYIYSTKDVDMVLDAYILGGLCLCIYDFSFYGWNIFNAVTQSTYIIRIGSEVGNENSFGITCAISVIFSVYFMIYKRQSTLKKIYYIIVITICTTFALLTASKKALIILLFAIPLLFICKKVKKQSIIKKIGLILMGFLFIYLLINFIQNIQFFRAINERFSDFKNLLFLGEGSETDLTRKYFIQKGLEVFSEHPFLGKGAFSSYSYFGTYSHNNYIEILMNTGIIGFAIFYFPYPIFFYKLIRIDGLNNTFKIIAIIFIIIYLIIGVGLIYYLDRYTQIIFAIISGFLSYEDTISKSNETA